MYRTIDRYINTSSVKDYKRSLWPRSVRTAQANNAVKAIIRRQLIKKPEILLREMKISTRTVLRIRLSVYHRYTGHALNLSLKWINQNVCSNMPMEDLRHFYGCNIFTIEEQINNDRMYIHSSQHATWIVRKV